MGGSAQGDAQGGAGWEGLLQVNLLKRIAARGAEEKLKIVGDGQTLLGCGRRIEDRVKLMRVGLRSLVLTIGIPATGLIGQTPAAPRAPAAAQAAKADMEGKAPSALLQPGLDGVKTALDGLHVDKWKVPGAIKEETTNNLGSIRRDIDGGLPPLLTAADGAPDSIAKVMPAYRNVEALYDVVLRVSGVARLAAPAQESAALGDALGKLEDGRRALGERLQTASVAQEKQVGDLRAQLKAVPPPVVAVAPACPPPPAPVKKKAPVKKAATPAAAKPATN